MNLITGTHRYQTSINCLDDFISADHPIRLIEVLLEKLDLEQLCVSMLFQAYAWSRLNKAPSF